MMLLSSLCTVALKGAKLNTVIPQSCQMKYLEMVVKVSTHSSVAKEMGIYSFEQFLKNDQCYANLTSTLGSVIAYFLLINNTFPTYNLNYFRDNEQIGFHSLIAFN